LRLRIAPLEELLDVQERTVTEHTLRLEQTLQELQRERARLRRSEELTRSTIAAALDAVVCLDANGVVIEWNPQSELILGWSREEARGQTVERLRLPLPRRFNAGADPPGSGGLGENLVLAERIEMTAVHRDGWDFPVELSVSRIGTGAGATYSLFLRDITYRKEAAENLAQARDSALAASRLKSEFLATMSHEIRTPMNGVVGMAELLLSTTLTPEQRDYAQAIQGSAAALLAVLNDILDFSKIEADKLVLESVSFDLRQAVEETASLLAHRAEQKGLELIVRYAPEAPCGLVGDPGRLRQILMNLIGNAIKFTERGHLIVEVDCEQQTPAAAQMRITVKDTGIGIAPEKLDSIFDKFSQADGSTTRKYGGTGLGLAISKRLVEMMGGELRVESRLGMGSTFSLRVTLPCDPQAAAAVFPEETLNGLRVLVVDDNEMNRRVMSEHLTRAVVHVLAVSSGDEALRALHEARRAGAPFEIGLLDHQMPGMDGRALAGVIRADPALANTVLVLFSSWEGQIDASRMQSAGFAAVLAKPVRQAELFQTLSRVRPRQPRGPQHTREYASSLASLAVAARHEKPNLARVLVAEDSLINQRVVSRMLEKLGCAVDIAMDGEQAVKMATTADYDLVFMDCQMPAMDGYRATAMIRRMQPGRHTPIIALTANAMEGDREQCLRAGMDDYLAKPVKVSDLTSALHKWLRSAAKAN
jgi:PAS domain S-box-containing protein